MVSKSVLESNVVLPVSENASKDGREEIIKKVPDWDLNFFNKDLTDYFLIRNCALFLPPF